MHGMSKSEGQEEVCGGVTHFLVGFEDHECGELEGGNMKNVTEPYDEEEEDDDLVKTL